MFMLNESTNVSTCEDATCFSENVFKIFTMIDS